MIKAHSNSRGNMARENKVKSTILEDDFAFDDLDGMLEYANRLISDFEKGSGYKYLPLILWLQW